MYLLRSAEGGEMPRVQLLGSGTLLREAMAAAELLKRDFGVEADVWSCPSFTELRRDGFDAERWNRLHPAEPPRMAHVTRLLQEHAGPVIAVTDYVRGHADQIRAFMPAGRRYTVLGTDGFGRSDTRAGLRRFFEVDRYWIAHAALDALTREGQVGLDEVVRAAHDYGIDPETPNPLSV
jgi:pyruvate dehydrogenase E1 component